MLNVQRFAHHNRSLLVMVFDPQDDTMFVAFGDKQISAKIRSADGLDYNVVKGVLEHSTFSDQIDRFLGGIIDAIKLPVTVGNLFYLFIDGALYNISEALEKAKSKIYGEKSDSESHECPECDSW